MSGDIVAVPIAHGVEMSEEFVHLRPGPVRRCRDGAWEVRVRPSAIHHRRVDGGFDIEERPERLALIRDPELAGWFSDLGVAVSVTAHGRFTAAAWEIDRVVPTVAQALSESPGPDLSGIVAPEVDDGLPAFLVDVRQRFEDGTWRRWNAAIGECDAPPGMPASTGMCLVSSACLAAALRKAFPEGGWTSAGGHPSVHYGRMMAGQFRKACDGRDGGMWVRGREAWDGHYWVTGRIDGREVIVDVTADQYGWEPVIVAAGDDPRYRANLRGAQVTKDMRGGILATFVETFVEDQERLDLGQATTPAMP